MRRMYCEKFILDIVTRVKALEDENTALKERVTTLEARKNYDISLDENNKLIIDDLNDNEEE